MFKIVISILIVSSVSIASTIKFNSKDGRTEFLAVGKPAMIKIKGHGEGPVGNLKFEKDMVSGTLSVDLSKLTTEIDLRDDHMKNKYLEIHKYPNAEIAVKNLKVPNLTEKETEVPFTADFTLHGKTQPISGTALIKKKDDQILGTANFDLKIINYLDTLPSYSGIKVAEDVKVTIELNGVVAK